MIVLVVGLGSIGKKHIDALYEINQDVKIFALRSALNNDNYKEVINIKDISELPVKPDFCIISNPTSLHETSILEMIKLKSPLFIEKPVLSKLEKSDLIIQMLQENKIMSYVACNMRFHPCILFLKEFLSKQKPRINEVNIYCGSYLPNWRTGKDFRLVYSANSDMGGGVHLDLIHELDYVIWLFNYPISTKSIKKQSSSLNINSVDSARYVLEYPEYTIMITLNYFRLDSKRYIEILTENDTIYIDLISPSVKSLVNNKILFQSQESINETYKKQIKYFISKVEKFEKPMNSFKSGVEILKIALC